MISLPRYLSSEGKKGTAPSDCPLSRQSWSTDDFQDFSTRQEHVGGRELFICIQHDGVPIHIHRLSGKINCRMCRLRVCGFKAAFIQTYCDVQLGSRVLTLLKEQWVRSGAGRSYLFNPDLIQGVSLLCSNKTRACLTDECMYCLTVCFMMVFSAT